MQGRDNDGRVGISFLILIYLEEVGFVPLPTLARVEKLELLTFS